jgi:DNA mismatch repair protein MutL
MVQRIHILPSQLANKIAAGEVVQRPASVVKELIENSIDAGATTLTVLIKESGKTLIQVLDNGIGMNADDALVAFERHATSKISSYDDLENIRTLGFRGEALASIAAVAQVEMRTREKSESVGTIVRVDGGEVKEVAKDAMQLGTSVTVRSLFYNTPARRAFLKSDNTEFKHIFDTLQRIAIVHPECKIKFISDDDVVLDLQPSSTGERVRDLFGERQSEGLIPVDERSELLDVSGFVSLPDYSRRTRAEQLLFLNGRYIVNRSINHAVFQAYEHLLEKGSFPFFLLMLAIDPRRVDVNVHPSKLEVKFEDERSVYRLVMSAVRKALLARDLAPMMRESTNPIPVNQREGTKNTWEVLLRPDPRPTPDQRTGGIERQGVPYGVEMRSNETASPQMSTDQSRGFSSLLWQVHSKYIVTSTPDGLMIVDQHVAHERVLYERIRDRLSTSGPTSQQLLFSHNIEMTPGDYALVKQLEPELTAMGFVLKFFGRTTIVLEGVPTDVRPGKETTILQEIIDLYKENEHDVKLEPRENLAKSFSCKAAIKAGDALNTEEMRSLLEQLFATQNPYVCPHGRPVIAKLTMQELDRRFGRPV